MRNVLLVISGPSGVGKGTIANQIIKRNADFSFSISCTTRKPRRGEKDGKEYFFISKEEFEKKIEKDGFLEYSQHFDNFYGTPKDFVLETLKSKSIILDLDVNGGLNVKKVFPDAVLVMILPPSLEELENRLKKRNTETQEQIELRLQRIKYEIGKKDEYDYSVVNDNLSSAVLALENIISIEKNK